jgi:hypothetical protein
MTAYSIGIELALWGMLLGPFNLIGSIALAFPLGIRILRSFAFRRQVRSRNFVEDESVFEARVGGSPLNVATI